MREELLSALRWIERKRITYPRPVPDDREKCYVPAGPDRRRRIAHAGLYADLAIVETPWVPEVDLHGSEAAIRAECASVLEFAWDVRRGCGEGWLELIFPRKLDWTLGAYAEALRRYEPYRAAIEALPEAPPNEAFYSMLTGFLFGGNDGPVPVLPGTDTEADVIRIANRLISSIHFANPMVGTDSPRARIRDTPSGVVPAEGVRAFSELVVSLGTFTAFLDGSAVAALRANGVRDDLREWLRTYLRDVELAALSGVDPMRELRRASGALADMAKRREEAIATAKSATFRQRLKAAGIWGTAGLVAGGVTLITSLPVGVLAAVVGFVGAAIAGATTTPHVSPDVPEHVLLRLAQQRPQQAP